MPALLLLVLCAGQRQAAGQEPIGMMQHLVERLDAEAACTRQLHAYGRAIDWGDQAALEVLFWPDAVIDLGFFKGNGPETVVFLIANAATSERRFHATSNIVLDIAGDQALADSCCVTHAVSADDEGQFSWQVFFGRYLDRLERRSGVWRFAERRFLLNFHHAGRGEESALLAAIPRAAQLSPQHPLFRFR